MNAQDFRDCQKQRAINEAEFRFRDVERALWFAEMAAQGLPRSHTVSMTSRAAVDALTALRDATLTELERVLEGLTEADKADALSHADAEWERVRREQGVAR